MFSRVPVSAGVQPGKQNPLQIFKTKGIGHRGLKEERKKEESEREVVLFYMESSELPCSPVWLTETQEVMGSTLIMLSDNGKAGVALAWAAVT